MHPPVSRRCRICLIEKPINEFYIDKRWKQTYKLDCKQCHRENKKTKYDPSVRKVQGLKSLYGITLEDLTQLHQKQNGMCSVCQIPISLLAGNTKKGKAHVDHDHITGDVRGLLCTKCNTLLGMANDSIEILSRSISYLKREL